VGASGVRVFYDHQVTSLQDAGGVSRYYFELARELSKMAVHTEWLLGWNRSVLPVSSLKPSTDITSYGTSVAPGNFRYAMNEALTAGFRCIAGRVDVYHATYQRILPFVRNRAIVATHHDSTPDRFPELFPDATAIHRRLQKVYARADRIICISESSRADLIHYFGVNVERTAVIHHGFSALESAEGESVITSPPEAPYALFVGSRTAYKNFSTLLEALSRSCFKDLQLVVAGGGPLTVSERQEIGRLGLESRIRVAPRPKDQELAALYRGANMFVYPSLYEGFGFPPLEAMHAGCPAIVSRTSALPEICGDAAFYFDPHSSEELADLISRMSADEEFRLSKRQLGFVQVKQYTWEKTAAETLAAYRTAIERA
jgi:glycosyltransferase involved in cell wall biosynthesis